MINFVRITNMLQCNNKFLKDYVLIVTPEQETQLLKDEKFRELVLSFSSLRTIMSTKIKDFAIVPKEHFEQFLESL